MSGSDAPNSWARLKASKRARWRAAQAVRRRPRMSGRGLVTLVALGAGAALGAALISWSRTARPPVPPPVSAAAPPLRVAAPPPPDAPRALLERLPASRGVLELPALASSGAGAGPVSDAEVSGRVFEQVPSATPDVPGPLQVEYTLDAELTRQVHSVLKRGRVALGHVIVLEPRFGRVVAYASTDLDAFPPTSTYPAASLVKVITAAEALGAQPELAQLPCRYTGRAAVLTPARIDPPRSGHTVSLREALATSNNQCFAQLAVHAVGATRLLGAIARFGWLASPGPAHAPGSAESGEDRYELGKLGCGLAGCRITPLHAAQLAGSLAHGELIAPRWVDRVVDADGRELPLPALPAPRRVMSPQLAAELREMLVDTTTRGTARRAFRERGKPVLGPVAVAGKTGSITSRDPHGRYEWFIGVAPAEAPRLAVAVLVVHGDRWWRNGVQIAAEVLTRVFCTGTGRSRSCSADHADRWLDPPPTTAASRRGRAPAG